MDTNLHSCLLVGFAGWAFILDMGGLSAEDLLRRKKALIHRKRELEEYKEKEAGGTKRSKESDEDDTNLREMEEGAMRIQTSLAQDTEVAPCHLDDTAIASQPLPGPLDEDRSVPLAALKATSEAQEKKWRGPLLSLPGMSDALEGSSQCETAPVQALLAVGCHVGGPTLASLFGPSGLGSQAAEWMIKRIVLSSEHRTADSIISAISRGVLRVPPSSRVLLECLSDLGCCRLPGSTSGPTPAAAPERAAEEGRGEAEQLPPSVPHAREETTREQGGGGRPMLSLGQVARVQGVCDVVAALCASHCGAAFTGAEGAGQLLKALLRLRGALDPLSAEHSPLPCSFGRAAERACVSMLLSEGLREDAVEEASGWVTEGDMHPLAMAYSIRTLAPVQGPRAASLVRNAIIRALGRCMRGKGKKVGGEESDDNWRPFGWDAGDALKCAEEAVRIATGGGNVENLKRYLGTGEQGQDFDRWRLAAALQLADMMLCCVAAEVSKSEDESPGGLSDELQDVMRAFYRFLKQACGTGSKALVLSRVVESDSLVTHVLHELKRQYEERSSGVLSPNKMMF